MSPLPRQRGVTEFHHKRWVISSSLMDQLLFHNPNLTPSRYPMKLWGLFGKVAHIAHITKQNFVIGQFANMNSFHCTRHPW